MPKIPEDLWNTGVYGILNNANGKWYVGSGAGKGGVVKRFRDHRESLRKGNHCNGHLQAAWNKYEEKSFSFLVLEEWPPEECLKREQEWIDVLQSANLEHGYNLCPTAGSNLGRKFSEETREKNRQGHLGIGLGKKLTEEHIAKVSKALQGHPVGQGTRNKLREAFLGKEHTVETKAKMSMAHSGKRQSDETKAKRSAALKGRKVSPEHCAKISADRKGKRLSAEHRAKIGAAQLGKKHSEERKRRISLGQLGREVSSETRKKISDGVRAARIRKLVEGDLECLS